MDIADANLILQTILGELKLVDLIKRRLANRLPKDVASDPRWCAAVIDMTIEQTLNDLQIVPLINEYCCSFIEIKSRKKKHKKRLKTPPFSENEPKPKNIEKSNSDTIMQSVGEIDLSKTVVFSPSGFKNKGPPTFRQANVVMYENEGITNPNVETATTRIQIPNAKINEFSSDRISLTNSPRKNGYEKDEINVSQGKHAYRYTADDHSNSSLSLEDRSSNYADKEFDQIEGANTSPYASESLTKVNVLTVVNDHKTSPRHYMEQAEVHIHSPSHGGDEEEGEEEESDMNYVGEEEENSYDFEYDSVNETVLKHGDGGDEDDEVENGTSGREIHVDVQEESSGKRRGIRFNDTLVSDVFYTRYKYTREETKELFYEHEEALKFQYDYDRELKKADERNLPWKDWILERTDEDVARDEREEQFEIEALHAQMNDEYDDDFEAGGGLGDSYDEF